jgi:hypothetical protein
MQIQNTIFISLILLFALFVGCASSPKNTKVSYEGEEGSRICGNNKVLVKNQEHKIQNHRGEILCAPIEELCQNYKYKKITIKNDGSYTCKEDKSLDQSESMFATIVEGIVVWSLVLLALL